MTVLGTITLWLTVVFAVWSLVAGITGLRTRDDALLESSRRGAVVLSALLAVTVICLFVSLVRHDFSITYVARHSSRGLSSLSAVAALHAGWNGVLLATVLAFALLCLPLLRPLPFPFRPVTALWVGGILLLGSLVLIVFANPFTRVPVTPLEGRGLDPRFRDVGFLFEAPLRVFGYAAAGAVAVRALSFPRGERGADAVGVARWLTAATLALMASLLMGAWHAYGMTNAAGSADWTVAHQVTIWVTTASAIALNAMLDVRSRRGRWGWPGSVAIVLAVAGVVLVVTGLLGWRFGPEQEIRLKPGRTATIISPLGASYELTHMGVSRFETPDRIVVAASLDADRNQEPVGLITSERRHHLDVFAAPVGTAVTTVGVRRGLLEDVRVVFLETTGEEEARYRVGLGILMSLTWLGGVLVMGSGILLLVETGE